MDNQVNQSAVNASVSNGNTDNISVKVYRKNVKVNGKEVTIYSGTRSDGSSVSFVFKCPIETESAAFEVSDVIGQLKLRKATKDGVEYNNYTYYVSSCKFSEIKGEVLPL